jgi:hypothetical protein
VDVKTAILLTPKAEATGSNPVGCASFQSLGDRRAAFGADPFTLSFASRRFDGALFRVRSRFIPINALEVR